MESWFMRARIWRPFSSNTRASTEPPSLTRVLRWQAGAVAGRDISSANIAWVGRLREVTKDRGLPGISLRSFFTTETPRHRGTEKSGGCCGDGCDRGRSSRPW